MLLAAGVADLAVAGLGRAVGGLRDLLSRADLGELAGAGRQEVRARGRLAVDRLASGPPARLEVLARRVVAARDTSSRS
ncbi:hypothetical protein HOY81_00010 [Streptomyces sp. JJ36]|nr:hypothetical protein [Streptomyces sp. JJ36]